MEPSDHQDQVDDSSINNEKSSITGNAPESILSDSMVEDDYKYPMTPVSASEEHTAPIKGYPMGSTPETSRKVSNIIYAVIAVIITATVVFLSFFSTSSQVAHEPSPNGVRDGLKWEQAPESMTPDWSVDGYTNILNTSGSIIGVKENGVERLDSQSGDVKWSYHRPDSVLCHAIEAGGNIAVLFDSGNGCSEIMTLDAATGERLNYAMYGLEDSELEARLVYGQDNIAIVTPEHARFLSMSLTPNAEFGARPDMIYPDDQEFFNCEISDVAIGSDHGIVASRCDDQTSFHVNAVDLEPEESTMGNIDLSIDTKSPNPVTIPMVSLAQTLFLTSGDSPTLYAWQLDKSKAEISATPMRQGVFPRGYWDVSGVGYVWLLGEQVNVRYGSEDISQSITRDGMVGNPLPAGKDLLLPKRGGIEVWNTDQDTSRFIEIEGFGGTDFAFAGHTVATFDRSNNDGTITAYIPDNDITQE